MVWINSEKRFSKEENICKNTWYDWYDWLINFITEPIKRPWVVLETKLRVFLKSRITLNQNLSKLCMKVEINQINKKYKNNQKKAT